MLGQLPFPNACQLEGFSPISVGVSQPHEVRLLVLNTGVTNAWHAMPLCQASGEFLSIFLWSGIVFHRAPSTGIGVFCKGTFQGRSPEQPVSSEGERREHERALT